MLESNVFVKRKRLRDGTRGTERARAPSPPATVGGVPPRSGPARGQPDTNEAFWPSSTSATHWSRAYCCSPVRLMRQRPSASRNRAILRRSPGRPLSAATQRSEPVSTFNVAHPGPTITSAGDVSDPTRPLDRPPRDRTRPIASPAAAHRRSPARSTHSRRRLSHHAAASGCSSWRVRKRTGQVYTNTCSMWAQAFPRLSWPAGWLSRSCQSLWRPDDDFAA
jgi:hypothetical protein